MTRDVPFNGHPRTSVLLLLVAVAGALPFISALGGPFLWDDTHLIENNPQVHSLSHLAQLFGQSFFETGEGSGANAVLYFRPLLHVSYALDWHLGSGNPAVFHATNLILAMLATGLVADCLMRWTQTTYWALLSTLVFAWHPSKAESVAWISGRTDLLATIFILLACKARSNWKPGSRVWPATELLATIGAYASKETAILLPLFIAVESWARSNHPALDTKGLTALLRATKWHLVGACLYLALRSRLFPLVSLGQLMAAHYSLSTRLGLLFETFGRATEAMVFPVSQSAEHGLAAFHATSQIVLSAPYMITGAISLLVLVAAIALTRRRAPAIAMGSAIVLIALGPTSNLIPTHLQCIFYERFLYLPSIGVALLATSLVMCLGKNRRAIRGSFIAIAVFLALALVRSVARANDYTSTEQFWTHELKVNPLSTTAHQNLVDVARVHADLSSAVRHLSDCHSNAVARRQHRIALKCAYDGAVLIADSTPDLDRKTLKATGDFFLAFATHGSEREARLALGNVTVTIDTSRPQSEALSEYSGESSAMLASIALKLDEPTSADFARSALRGCSHCRYALRAARVLAATGHTNEAMQALAELERNGPLLAVARVRAQIQAYVRWMQQAQVLDGAARIQATAQAHLVLGRYGAAYNTLKPYAGEIARNREASLQYAQVAYYAGDAPGARAVLGATLQQNAIDQVLSDWGKAVVPSSD